MQENANVISEKLQTNYLHKQNQQDFVFMNKIKSINISILESSNTAVIKILLLMITLLVTF